MPLLTAPHAWAQPAPAVQVFLAGSIEMGAAEPWQAQLAQQVLAVRPQWGLMNPRRERWDSRWEQRLRHPAFREQVEWELDHLARADLVVFYFQAGTQSPITLLELGQHLARPDAAASTLIACPEGFWRLGNVEVVSARAGLPPPLPSLQALVEATVQWSLPPKTP